MNYLGEVRTYSFFYLILFKTPGNEAAGKHGANVSPAEDIVSPILSYYWPLVPRYLKLHMEFISRPFGCDQILRQFHAHKVPRLNKA